jgi:putative phosphoribosyl transferase
MAGRGETHTVTGYADREEAARLLADRLGPYAGRPSTVLALPRGGVPIGAIIAERLHAPLDVLVVRKVGAPGNPEYGLGAVAEGGIVLIDDDRVRELGLTRRDLEVEIARKQQEVAEREQRYRGDRPPAPVDGRVAILVDDGLATGVTARAAIRAVRARHPAKVVFAVGVAARESRDAVARLVDDLVCPCVPSLFMAVGEWYRDFPQVSDDEVRRLLAPPRVPNPAVAVHA